MQRFNTFEPQHATRALDLADEAMWEDVFEVNGEFESFESIAQEDRRQPVFGMRDNELSSGIHAYVSWWADGDEDCTNAHG